MCRRGRCAGREVCRRKWCGGGGGVEEGEVWRRGGVQEEREVCRRGERCAEGGGVREERERCVGGDRGAGGGVREEREVWREKGGV